MNYGHGGHITPHKDSFSSRVDEKSCSEHFTHGGQRIVTFMMYLTDIGSKLVISLKKIHFFVVTKQIKHIARKKIYYTISKFMSGCLCMPFFVYILLKLFGGNFDPSLPLVNNLFGEVYLLAKVRTRKAHYSFYVHFK